MDGGRTRRPGHERPWRGAHLLLRPGSCLHKNLLHLLRRNPRADQNLLGRIEVEQLRIQGNRIILKVLPSL